MAQPAMLRIFISSTTPDLGECRRAVAEVVRQKGHEPVFQDEFHPEAKELPELLQHRIRDTHAVILIVGCSRGRMLDLSGVPGSEWIPEAWRKCSYTQLEFFLTLHWKRPFFLLWVAEGSSLDATPPGAERVDQSRFREHVRERVKNVRHPVKAIPDAVAFVEGIRFEDGLYSPLAETHQNPFDPHHPAIGEAFVGRCWELRELEDHQSLSRSVSLVGDTRIGKSSLLRTWGDNLRRLGERVVELDGQSCTDLQAASVVSRIIGGNVEGSADVAATRLEQWCQSGQVPVVMIDEFEALVRCVEIRFFERLRSMIDRRLLVLVLASRSTLVEAFKDCLQVTSPIGNNVTTLRVRLLDESAAAELAGRAGGQGEWIRRWAGEHPHFLQLAGYWTVRQPDREFAEQRFKVEAYQRLTEIWNGLNEREKRELRRLLDQGAAGSGSAFTLKQRGLLREDGTPFGEVLTAWWREDPPNS